MAIFMITILIFAIFLLAFALRQMFQNKEDIFKLSARQRQDVIEDMLPDVNLSQLDADPDVNRMLNILNRKSSSDTKDYSK